MPQRIPAIGEEVPPDFGLRADGSAKGNGYLGVLKRPDGSVSSEISIGVNLDGKEMEIPTLVPTLTSGERNWLLSNDISDPKKIPQAIKDKAIVFARQRIAAGQSPFATSAESAKVPAIGEEVPQEATPRMNFATVNGQRVPIDAPRERTWGDTAMDLSDGIKAGMANTVFRGGDVIRRAVGMDRVIDNPDVQALITPPDSTPGKLGYHGEQIAEFFLPTGITGKLGKAAEVLKSGALTLAQTGSPTQAGISGALTAVIPGAAAMERASGALENSAQKSMAQALGATKEWAKDEAAKLAPQMLQRGVGGSRAAMLETAKTMSARFGSELNAAYAAAAENGSTVPSDVIQGYLQLAANGLKVKDATGTLRVIPGTEHVVDKLDELGRFVASLGAEIPVDRAAHIKRTWDAIVSKAGLFGPKATSSATDNAGAWAIREAASNFRQILNTNPTIDALNQESAFWGGLKKVLKATEKRTQAQSGGLVRAGMGGAGAVMGGLSGGSTSDRVEKAALYGLAGRGFVSLVQSPAFRTQVAGPMKQLLANALASGSAGEIQSVTARILASIPAQFRPSFAP